MASIAAIVVFAKIKKLPVLKTIDIIAFAFALVGAASVVPVFVDRCGLFSFECNFSILSVALYLLVLHRTCCGFVDIFPRITAPIDREPHCRILILCKLVAVHQRLFSFSVLFYHSLFYGAAEEDVSSSGLPPE